VKLRTALRLGRVSNLPTVWTNTLAGAVLAGAGGYGAQFALMLLAFSLFYTGGMFLNDAFDAPFDALQRPERPIPSGEIGARAVFAWGFGLMAAGIALLAWIGVAPALAGVTLAVAITLYDWRHKQNLFGPVVMGLCRVLVYVAAGLCVTLALPDALWIGAALMWCYLIGLTYVAKQENLDRVENFWPLLFLAAPVGYGAWLAAARPVAGLFWLLFSGWLLVALWFLRRRAKGDVPRAVVSLIAGISLLDAVFLAAAGSVAAAGTAVLGFLLTLALQRFVAGT
jgi:4-hydroxybenzoate polyprenyltransferase